MKLIFLTLLSLIATNAHSKYDCAYLKKYCAHKEYAQDEWGDFYCGDFVTQYEVELEGNKFIFKKNGEVFINKNKVGVLSKSCSEFLLHQNEKILLLEANSHEEVGSTGIISIVDMKKKTLIEIGHSAPLYHHQIEIVEDKIHYHSDGYCWDYSMKNQKSNHPSRDECMAKFKNKAVKISNKTVKASYAGKKDEYNNYIPNSIKLDDLDCNELVIAAGTIKWKKTDSKK